MNPNQNENKEYLIMAFKSILTIKGKHFVEISKYFLTASS